MIAGDCPSLVDVPDVAGMAVIGQLGVQVVQLEVAAPGVRGVGCVRGRAAVVGGVTAACDCYCHSFLSC